MTPPLLPETAPFPADQIAALNGVMSKTDATQRTWLAGFLAGYQAAAGGQMPSPAAAPVAKAPLTVLFATESGNAEALAEAAKKLAARQGFAAKVLDAADATPEDLARARNVLLIVSTWGEGEPPQRAAGFYGALMADGAPQLAGLRYAVLALGDRAYANFCETGRRIDERLAALGATRIAGRIECDLDYEAPSNAWIGTTLETLKKQVGQPGAAADNGAVIHVDFGRIGGAAAPEVAEYGKANPFAAEITGLVNLNSSRSAKETFHVELSLEGSGIAYEPGDALGIVPENDPAVVDAVLKAVDLHDDAELRAALCAKHDCTLLTGHLVRSYAELIGDAGVTGLAGDAAKLEEFLEGRHVVDLFEAFPNRLTAAQLTQLLRPLPPRLYSVASSRKAVGEEAHLLIGAVRYATHGRARAGVASTYVGDRRRAGDALRVYLKANKHFRLPADPAAPVIMIGPGTGVAPFRGFMQERDALGTTGRNWLFFGDQRYTHDFLYQLEWQDLLARGVLTRLDVAFSRDQDEKRYVQHRMWEQRRELYAWLQDGAHLYVCGDQARMAKDVHATLGRIIADGAGVGTEEAASRLDALKREGRYKLDVY